MGLLMGRDTFFQIVSSIYIGTICGMLGKKLVNCLKGQASLPVSPKQKSF